MTAAVILLVLQLGRVYLRLQWRRKRSTARFRRQLLRGGMSPEQGVPIVPIERGSSLYGEVMADLAMAQRVLGQASSNYART